MQLLVLVVFTGGPGRGDVIGSVLNRDLNLPVHHDVPPPWIVAVLVADLAAENVGPEGGFRFDIGCIEYNVFPDDIHGFRRFHWWMLDSGRWASYGYIMLDISKIL